jgi:hypothetical protein
MIVLDENIIDSQRHLLRDRGIAFRQIGVEVGQSGMSDQQVLALLHGLNRPTFFTRDDDFYERRLCHLRYCLVYIDADDEEVAEYVAATLRHPDLKTWTQRQGVVLRVSSQGGRAWRLHAPRETQLTW